MSVLSVEKTRGARQGEGIGEFLETGGRPGRGYKERRRKLGAGRGAAEGREKEFAGV